MKVYFVSGEPSGDILAAGLMKALRRKDPQVEFVGVGGESMEALGFKSLFNISELAVMGIFEVLPRLFLILRRMREVIQQIKDEQPDVIVTVDSWGFVSTLLGKLKKEGIKIPKVHYVAPQVWAWKKGRAKKVAKLTDRLLTLLPNEPAYFEKYGLKCDFVGHPVVENTAHLPEDHADFYREYQIPQDRLIVCILPGSRKGEVSRLVPVFQDALARLQKQHPKIFVLLPTVDTVAQQVAAAFEKTAIPFRLLGGQQNRYRAFQISRVAMAASGTVSLELTACRTPHIIAYTFSTLTNWFAKLMVKIKYVNLINILADREIIPEFLVDRCRGDLIADKIEELIEDPETARQQQNDAQVSLQKLRLPHILPSDRAAEVVLEMANRG